MESITNLLASLGVILEPYQGEDLVARSPIDGAVLANLRADQAQQVTAKITRAKAAFDQWRNLPAPRRGELVRLFGDELRTHKQTLGKLVTLEAGKILQEGFVLVWIKIYTVRIPNGFHHARNCAVEKFF